MTKKAISPILGIASAVLFLSPVLVQAANLTWDGGAGTPFNWSDDSNWGDNTVGNGDNLLFSGTVGMSNVNDTTGLSLGSLSFQGTTSNWVIGNETSPAANGFSLSGGILMTGTVGVSISSNITLTQNQVFDNSSSNHRTLNMNGNMTLDIGSYNLEIKTVPSTSAGSYSAVTLDYGSVLKGSGTLTKTGGGIFMIRGTGAGNPFPDFTGDILVNEGTLRSYHVGGLGSDVGTTTVADGATLLLQGTGSIAEYISIQGEGMYYPGDKVQRGALAIWTNSILTRTLTLDGDTDVGFRYANTLATISAGISESVAGAGLIKVGSYADPSVGFLRITGNSNLYTGETTVKGGGLILDGTHGSSSTRVDGYNITHETLSQEVSGVTGGITSQSLLAGEGTVYLKAGEQITISGASDLLPATFAPGTISAVTSVTSYTSGIGTFTVDAGDGLAGVTFGDNSVFAVQLGSEGASDRLVILNGALTIAGSAMLNLIGTLTDGEVYTLAQYDSVSGAFSSVAGLDSGWYLHYDSNALTLSQTPIPEPSTFAFLASLSVLLLAFLRQHRQRTA